MYRWVGLASLISPNELLIIDHTHIDGCDGDHVRPPDPDSDLLEGQHERSQPRLALGLVELRTDV